MRGGEVWVWEGGGGGGGGLSGAVGNPDGFWETLHRLGIDPLFRWVFPDHHVYRPRELRHLAAQARKYSPAVLLTTKKDVMNLPDNYAELIAPVELLWLEVETRVENQRALFDFISRALAPVPPPS